MYRTNWRGIWLWIPVFAASLALAGNAQAEAVNVGSFIRYHEGLQKISWSGFTDLEYAIGLGPNRPAPAAPYAIGFSHLGYSEADPDGMAATLTLAVKASTHLVHPGDGTIRVVEFVPQSLDISLEAFPAEEARLRMALKLPRPMAAADAVAPFQVRWKSVAGADLHGWLVGPGGLTWKLSGIIRTRLTVVRTERVEPGCVDSWWSKTVPGQVEGLSPDLFWLAAVDLALAGCFQMQLASRTSTGPTPDYERNFISKLQTLAAGQASLANIKQAGAPTKSTSEAEVEIPFVVSFSPGDFLRKRPDYVKDLSGKSVGLDGLLGKK